MSYLSFFDMRSELTTNILLTQPVIGLGFFNYMKNIIKNYLARALL